MSPHTNRRRRQPTALPAPGVALSSVRTSAPSLGPAGRDARGTGILPHQADLSTVGSFLGHVSYTPGRRHRALQQRANHQNGMETNAACAW